MRGAWGIVAILLAALASGGIAGEVKKGAVVVAPVVKTRVRSFQDVVADLIGGVPSAGPAQVSGVIVAMDAVDGMQMTLRRRDKTLTIIEFLAAAKSPEFPPLGTGKAITAIGNIDGQGLFHAQTIMRVSPSQDLWPVDQ
jgi:hypothetical protein